MHVFPIAAGMLATLATFASAAPAEDHGISKRWPTCTGGGPAGSTTCGWDLINRGKLASPESSHLAHGTITDGQAGWDYQTLRRFLCEQTGKCDMNSGDVWNTLWKCTGDYSVAAMRVCGGQDSCVIDRFNWAFTCRGGSC